jgi:hypothetical protein
MRSQSRANDARNAKETTTMDQIDKQAALDELKKAAHLKAKADELGDIADELEQEAERHEHDAMDLIAPTKTPLSSTGRRP